MKIVLTVDGRRPGQTVNLQLLLKHLFTVMPTAGHDVRIAAQDEFSKEEWLERFDDHQSWKLAVDDDEIVVGFELPPVAMRRYGDRAISIRRHPLRFTGNFQILAGAPVQNVLTPWLLPTIPRPAVKPVRGNALFACQVRDDTSIFSESAGRPYQPVDFELKLQQLFARYERVFVRPHPEDRDSAWVQRAMEFDNAELQDGCNAYAAMESAERVIAVSSSMLAEAPYFGAEAIPLLDSLPNTRNRISLETLAKPEFWEAIL